MVTQDPHPLAELGIFVTVFPQELAEMKTPVTLLELLRLDAPAPLSSNDKVRESVRALLRHGGFKPTGRSKPASEYLIRAVGDNALSSINWAVDCCNVVSLHSGLPISVIDLDLAQGPLRIGIAPMATSYIFNQAGQTIDLGGLLCLFDKEGPCACGVKDAQRTKTSGKTTRTLSVVWGTKELSGRTAATVSWYQDLLRLGNAEITTIVE